MILLLFLLFAFAPAEQYATPLRHHRPRKHRITRQHTFGVYTLKKFNLEVVKLSPQMVDAMCGDTPTWDDGEPVKPGSHFAGCTLKPKKRWFHRPPTTIIVRWDDVGARALLHELHHAAGLPPEFVDTIGWDEYRIE